MSTLSPVGVFWDIENCCVPKGKSALKIIERIRERFFTNCREAEFICVCDINKESDNTIKDLNDGQINVVHINATAKNAADDKIRQSLRRFSDSHPPGTKVILISSDVNFASDLSDLRHRKRYEVVLIHKNQVSEALLLCATEHHSYEDLIKDLPDRPGYKEATDCVLVVSGYNREEPPERVRTILKMHSNNCGGKVISIGPLFALLKFETSELMERAKKRMNGEDVYGRKITVCLPEETTFQNTIRKLTASHVARRQESPSPQRYSRRDSRLGSRSYTPEGQESSNNSNIFSSSLPFFQPYEQYHSYHRGSAVQESAGFQFVPSSVNLGNKAYKTPGGPTLSQSLSPSIPQHSWVGGDDPNLSPSHTYTLPNSNSERYYHKSSPGAPTDSESRPSSAPKALERMEPLVIIGDLSTADCGKPITVFKPGGQKSLKDIPIPSFGFSTIPPPPIPSKSALDPNAASFDPIKLIETASREMHNFRSNSTSRQTPPISHPDQQSPLKPQLSSNTNNKTGHPSAWDYKKSGGLHKSASTTRASAFSTPSQQNTTYQDYGPSHHQARSSSVPVCTGPVDSRALEDEICRSYGYPPECYLPCSQSPVNSVFKKPTGGQKPFKTPNQSNNYHRRMSPANRGSRDLRNSFSSDGEDRAKSPSANMASSKPRPRLPSIPGANTQVVNNRPGQPGRAGCTQSPLSLPTSQRPKMKQHGSHLYRVPTPNEMGDPATDYTNENFDPSRGDPFVELVVSNLDYNIHPREWRKIIYATFHPHVQVLSIQVRLQADNTSVATVRLASEQDARFAITQFHRRKIGYKRINVQLKSDCSQSPAESLRADTIALLMEAKDNKLALSRLIDLFDKRFHKTVSVSDIYKMRDILEIQETGGAGRWVRLQHGIRRSPTLSLTMEGESEVPEQPVCTMHCPEGSVKYTEVMNSCMLPNVQLLRRHFAPQLHSLLLSHNGYIPLMSFPACYEAEFSPLSTAGEEGIPLEHVVSCVPGVEIVMTKAGVKLIQFQENRDQFYDMMKGTSWQELGKISREVMELLRTQATCSMPVSKFIPAYHHYFGRQCRVADYGYTKLQELFEAIPHAIQILGSGDRKTIALSPRAQLKRFTTDIIKVVKAQPAKQIMMEDFPQAYEKAMGKPLFLPHYGVAFMDDVLLDIPTTTLIVIKESHHTLLALPRRDQTAEEVERTKQFGLEVVDLLKQSPQARMAFNKFIPAYHHHFGKQCRVADYGYTKLTDLFEAIAHVVELEEDGEERFLHLASCEQRRVLCEQLTNLIGPQGRIPVDQLLAQYANHYGFCLKVEEFGVNTVSELVYKLKKNIKVDEIEGRQVASLVREVQISPLGLQVMQLLMDDSGGCLPLLELCMRYESLFGHQPDMGAIKEELVDYVQIDDSDSESGGTIRLTSHQMLGRNLRLLLLHASNISMSELPSQYRQQYGVELSPALYGFQSLYQLLLSFPHLLQVRGKPHHKYIQLSNTLSTPGTIPPTKVDVSPKQFSPPTSDGQQVSSNVYSQSEQQQQPPVENNGTSSPSNSSPAFDLLQHASLLWNPSMARQQTPNSLDPSTSISSTRIVDLIREQTTKSPTCTTPATSTEPISGVSPPDLAMQQLKLSPNGVPEVWQMKAGGDSASQSPKEDGGVLRGNLVSLVSSITGSASEDNSGSSGISRGDRFSKHRSSSFKEDESEEDIFCVSDNPLETSSTHSNQSTSPVKGTTIPQSKKTKTRIAANFKVL